MKKIRVPKTPEFLRSEALREAPRIARFGWRPSERDLVLLRSITKDPITYRTYLRAWKSSGFRLVAIKRLAGRAP